MRSLVPHGRTLQMTMHGSWQQAGDPVRCEGQDHEGTRKGRGPGLWVGPQSTVWGVVLGGENERTILGREGVELTGNGAGSRSERLGLGGGTARLPGVHTFGAGLLVIFTRFW